MITSSGAVCDVCGKYILPVVADERVNFFRIAQAPGQEFCAHNDCKQIVLDCNGDWEKLPPGPLRTTYEKASLLLAGGKSDLRT